MNNDKIFLIGIVCLCGGYLLGRAHAFVKAVFNDVHIQNNKQDIVLSNGRNQEQQIEHSIKRINTVLAEIIEQMEATKQ